MRVYELARILGVTSKDLIAELKRIRVAVKSASASIEDKQVRKVMDRFEKRKVEEAARKKKEEAEQRRKEREERRKREEERKKREEEERRQREEEERKRREEEERKKREEEERRQREEENRKRREQEELQRRQEEQRKAAKTHPPAPVVAESKEVDAEARPRPLGRRARRREKDLDKPLEVIDLPKIEVMRLDDPRKLYAERARRRAKERRKERDRKGKGVAVGDAVTGVVEAEAGEVRKRPRRIRPTFVVAPAPKREPAHPIAPSPVKPPEPRVVRIHGEVTVGQFAEKTDIPVSDVIAKLLSLGAPLTINQILDNDLCELLGLEFGVGIEVIPESDEYDLRDYLVADQQERMVRRPPVVTIMGHVDHGKTTLLDYIRSSRVVEGEVGGITQHIGAYRVETPRGEITFLDTPGHEAFTSMRARGALVTDIVVLIVAADDGVMPQTVEAIDHARAAHVPIVVAINKIDLPGANPTRVRQELMQYNLVPEELGGETIFGEVSAKTGEGVDHLLEMILLQSEVLELKADPLRRAEGVVIEARVVPTRGPVTSLLVQKGTLHVGDALVIGRHYGRVRAMLDETGRPVMATGPSCPVEVLGLGGSPEAGERFLVMPNERSARNVAATRDDRRRQRLLGTLGRRHVTLENLHDLIEEGEIKEFRLILKGDVQGSIEAIAQALARLPSDKIKLRILHSAVGPVTESDVNLARASDAIIIGFGVRPDPAAQALADREDVDVRLYRVIYELIDDVRKAMTAALEPVFREVALGRAEVRQTFRISKIGVIAGCFVSEGEVRSGANVRLVRDGVVVYDGTIASLRRVKDDVSRVQDGLECGIALANFQDIKEGDLLEVYTREAVPVEL